MPNAIKNQLKAIEDQNLFLVGASVSCMIFLALLALLWDGRSPLLAVIIFIAVIVPSISGMVAAKTGKITSAKVLLSLGFSVIVLGTTLLNGGYGDPRTVGMLIAAPFTFTAIVGLQHWARITTIVFVYSILVAIAQYLGVLQFLFERVDPSSDTLKLINTGLFLVLAFVSGSLLARISSLNIAGLETIATRVQALSQQLEQSLDEALTAKQAESRFLSNMSHEIRNPLNGVLGLVRHAIEEDDPAQTRDLLKSALSSGEHLRRILDDVLNLKKMEAEEFTLEHESIDFKNDVSKRASLIYQNLAAGKNISIVSETDFDALPRYFIGDSTRLIQIVTNILSNAIKFSPEGGVVTVKTSYNYDTGELTYRVSDTGIGMSEETLRNLFTRFRQASDGTTKGFQGTGLGLAITKRLVDLMGGSISVESELGKGTTFTLTAPIPVDWERENKAGTAEQAEHAEQLAESHNPLALEGMRVLCVDDSSINLKVVSRPLIKAGASVTTALSGKEALELIRVHDFDIVLTDISMPEMDGEQLQQELKAWKLNLPVVAITGNVLEEDVKRYLANGFVAALGKPLDMEQLLTVVRDNVAAKEQN